MWPSIILCLPLCSVVRLSVGIHCCSSTSLALSFTCTPVWYFQFLYYNIQKVVYYSVSLKTNGLSSLHIGQRFQRSLSVSSLSIQRSPLSFSITAPIQTVLKFYLEISITHSFSSYCIFLLTQTCLLSLLVRFSTLNLPASFLPQTKLNKAPTSMLLP